MAIIRLPTEDLLLTLESLKLAEMNVPMGTSWLLAACMEARGKQDLWIGQKPEVLRTLREQAIIQSTESSNRIEGVTVSPERLRPVVIGKVKRCPLRRSWAQSGSRSGSFGY